ncbi:MAG TPA: hypothetical protein VKA48_07540, partial [Gammaproteobacteria bacterium]|nr:hypothetical protein [Gammaproteobacteria bacterium]
AINAQLAVARAGEEARAFEVISARLESFSRETPRMVYQIHREAVTVTRLLVKVHQTEGAHARFEQARIRSEEEGGGEDVGYLEGALDVDRRRLAAVKQEAEGAVDRFDSLLGRVEGKLAAASHLALNARVEAAKTSSYRHQFASVAEEVNRTVNRTREVVEAVHGELGRLDEAGKTRQRAEVPE